MELVKKSNVIQFPSKKNLNCADKLLVKFVEISNITDRDERSNRLSLLFLSIFGYVSSIENKKSGGKS